MLSGHGRPLSTARMEAMSTESLRRRPTQRRSTERVERILDEAARLLDEVGYEGMTTKEVARRAEVPIGTLYQFFPGKGGLVRALAGRNLDRYLDRLSRRLAAEGAATGVEHWSQVTDLAVEEYVAMRRAVPGFGVVDFGESGAAGALPGDAGHLLDAVLENNAVVADRLRALLAVGSSPGLDRALLVAVECTDAVLKIAFRADPDGDPELIAECKRLLRAYLSEPLGSATPAPR